MAFDAQEYIDSRSPVTEENKWPDKGGKNHHRCCQRSYMWYTIQTGKYPKPIRHPFSGSTGPSGMHPSRKKTVQEGSDIGSSVGDLINGM